VTRWFPQQTAETLQKKSWRRSRYADNGDTPRLNTHIVNRSSLSFLSAAASAMWIL
jgi:hypothetical protein